MWHKFQGRRWRPRPRDESESPVRIGLHQERRAAIFQVRLGQNQRGRDQWRFTIRFMPIYGNVCEWMVGKSWTSPTRLISGEAGGNRRYFLLFFKWNKLIWRLIRQLRAISFQFGRKGQLVFGYQKVFHEFCVNIPAQVPIPTPLPWIRDRLSHSFVDRLLVTYADKKVRILNFIK